MISPALFSVISMFFVIGVLILLVLVFLFWVVVRRRKAALRRDMEHDAELEVWHEGVCPVCLALYTAYQLRPLSLEAPL